MVDVTDPTNPHITGRAPGSTSTHTVACANALNCTYAYSAGSEGRFSIVDLRTLDQPREVDGDTATAGVQGFGSPTYGRKWNFDAAGYGTQTGYDSASMWDVRKPPVPEAGHHDRCGRPRRGPPLPGLERLHPAQLAAARREGVRARCHPVGRPWQRALRDRGGLRADRLQQGRLVQTWWVKRLDGTRNAIVPLDKVELADLGNFPSPQGAFCSSLWFDYHPSGIAAVAFYGGGTQFIDTRNPRDLKPYGHATWGASEVWDSYWLPVYDKAGAMASKKTNLASSVDLVRGLDVYRVDLPGTSYDPSTNPSAGGGWSSPVGTAGGTVRHCSWPC